MSNYDYTTTMSYGLGCVTETRLRPALRLDIFIEILLGDSVNRVKSPLEGLLSGLPLTFLRGLLP